MKIRARMGDCVIELSDADSSDPLTSRYADQNERLIDLVELAKETVIEMYETEMESL